MLFNAVFGVNYTMHNMTPSQMNLPQAIGRRLENAQNITYYIRYPIR